MKKLIVMMLLLATGLGAAAQIRFGIKAGMNASQFMTGDIADNNNPNLGGQILDKPMAAISSASSATIPGFMFGGFANYSFSRVLGVQAELLFSQQGADMTYELSLPSTPHSYDRYYYRWREQIRLNYINLPVLLEVKPFKNIPLGLLAGPQIGYLVHSSYEGVKTSDDVIMYRKLDVAAVLGIQYTACDHLVVGIRYNAGLNDVVRSSTYFKHYTIDNNELIYPDDPRGGTHVLQLSVGWRF